MAGTIVVDRIESDASYASSINVANRITFSNTVNFGVFAGTAPVAGFYLPATNALAFTTASTERMRINSTGAVLVNTVTQTGSTRMVVADATGNGQIRAIHSTGSGLLINQASASGAAYIQQQDNADLAFATNNTERMRITSTGKVGIGNSSPDAQNLHVGSGAGGGSINGYTRLAIEASDYAVTTIKAPAANFSQIIFTDPTSSNLGGINFFNSTNATPNAMAFLTGGGNERMRIDSSGNVLIGTTAQLTNEKFAIDVSGSGRFAFFRGQNTSGNPTVFRISTGNFSGGIGSGNFIYCDDGGSIKFFVAGSGAVNSTSTSITAISDVRLKENIRDLETGLDSILSLKPRRFDWKENQGTNKKNVAGFIAQEVETILPELIGEWKNDPDDEIVYKSLTMGDMIPTLVKAIQEQQALITSLTARITALESN
jgi:hypothetical protein